jgi:hypothetical protein
MLDDRARRERKDKQIEACPNCARIRTANEAAIARNKAALDASLNYKTASFMPGAPIRYKSAVSTSPIHRKPENDLLQIPSHDTEIGIASSAVWDYSAYGSTASPAVSNSSTNSRLLGSPVTRQILGRQKHTRHASIDVTTSKLFAGGIPTTYGTAMPKKLGDEMFSHRASTNFDGSRRISKVSSMNKLRSIASSENLYDGTATESEDESSAVSSSTLSSTEAIWDGSKSQLNAAKYVFVTLRLALMNSMVIIAVGCVGFWLIEGFELVDSWYFTTVLLTTVG